MEENNTQPENDIRPKVMHTFADNMAEVIESDRSGLVKKIIKEEEDKEFEKKVSSPESKQNKIFIALGFLFLGCAAAIIIFLFWEKEKLETPQGPYFQPMIFSDQTKFLPIDNLSKAKTITLVTEERDKTEVKEGGVLAVYLTRIQSIVGLRDFIDLMEGKLILPSKQAVDDNFMIGLLNGDTENLFFLLRMREFSDIFKSMQDWEGKMFLDLHQFFDTEISAVTNYLLTKDFENGFIENKNARILYKEDGSIALMYVFADATHVVITDSTDAAREVVLRLAGTQIAK